MVTSQDIRTALRPTTTIKVDDVSKDGAKE